MFPRDTTLLYLVFCLSQKMQAQEGDFPRPIISAESGPVIPWNGSARIRCQGTSESYLYQLMSLKNSSYKEVEKKLGIQKEAKFILNHMDANSAGRYQCRYRKKFSWSPYSADLELAVADAINQDYTLWNLIRLGMAGLVLMALLAVLAEHWHNQRMPHQEGWPNLAEPSWGKQKCQAEWTFGQTPSGCRQMPEGRYGSGLVEANKTPWRTQGRQQH
ncbi:immunoglobulin alpha Fc receptor-like [Carlito syrichta]|uniref:immunoglobulin alpha Fc receptor-like n=1 Tax=Carlito syrichta TaxID=1868482 RepID=UPI00046B472C|nr:immunoglobulin alpha Fc receptor-like [Carlito syrichta]